jgi:hypothetical protein
VRERNSIAFVQNPLCGMRCAELPWLFSQEAAGSTGIRDESLRRRCRSSCRRLLEADVEACCDFDALHALVLRLIDPIPRIAELTVYDTSLRIGAKLGLYPRTVYLHRGSRDGARALGLDRHAPFLRVEELPQPFRRLEPFEVEDCLCIYKKFFSRTRAGASQPGNSKAPS